MVLAETFGHSLLRQSLARLFQRDEQGLLDMAWHATLDVLTPPVRIPPPPPSLYRLLPVNVLLQTSSHMLSGK